MNLVSTTSRLTGQALKRRGAVSMSSNGIGRYTNAAVEVLLLVLAMLGLYAFVKWAVFNAVWSTPSGDSSLCRAVEGNGACWALVAEKYRFLLFAAYPFDEQWRPALACALLIGLYVVTALPRFWRKELVIAWAAVFGIVSTLMWGGVAGLSYVPQEAWGGLAVTLILSTFAILLAFPLGILVALGRQASSLPVIRYMCIFYIEIIRGVPLVSLLFMVSFVFPLFLPEGFAIEKLLRAQLALILFSAAYLAEVVRGGLQGVAPGQSEAASALGIGYWRTQRLVVIPQALSHCLPSLVNTFISILKSTSLVMVVGIFDLLSAGKAAIVDPQWQGFGLEMLLVVSLIYFFFCFPMSKYSQYIEKRVRK
jgi:general L-amino acid transport system permease protein